MIPREMGGAHESAGAFSLDAPVMPLKNEPYTPTLNVPHDNPKLTLNGPHRITLNGWVGGGT